MADFSVDTAKLRDLAGSLDGRAHETRAVLQRAGGAAVSADEWGPLGHERGLPDLYTEVLASADRTLSRVFDFFGDTSDALRATAVDYDEQDREMARTFTRIDGGGAGPTGGRR